MVLSHVQTETPMALVRASAWANSLSRMGVPLPLFLVHDIGVMLSMTRGAGGYVLRPRESQLARVQMPAAAKPQLEQYRRLLENIAASEVTERLAGLRLRDEMVAVLLSRILGDTYNRWRDRSKSAGVEPLPLDLGILGEIDFADHFRDFDPRGLWAFLEHLVAQSMHVYTQVELIDLDTVRLLGLFKEDSASGSEALGGAIDLVDLFSALGSPEANDVANFSLDLLPSVLETRRSTGAQTFAVDGYASIERKGAIDSLLDQPSLVCSYCKTRWRPDAAEVGRRFFDWNSGRRFLRSASVGLPSPVQTKASRARRATRSGRRSANTAAFSAPEEMPYMRSFCAPDSRSASAVPASRSSAPFSMPQLTGRDLSERP